MPGILNVVTKALTKPSQRANLIVKLLLRTVSKSLVILGMVCATASTLSAAAVYLKETDVPVLGFVKSRTETHLNMIINVDGQRIEQQIPIEEIAEVLETVNAERLAKLDPGQLSDYRDYAEELTVKRADPEARETAIRLFLVAAFFGEDKMRTSALRGLVSLARNEEERRSLLTLAFRHGAIDPPVKSSTLSSSPVAEEVRLTDEQRDQLATLIRSARKGFSKGVRTKAMEADVKTIFSENSLGMSHEEFIDLISKADLGTDSLLALVELELRALERPDGGNANPSAKSDRNGEPPIDWAQLAGSGEAGPVALFDMTNVTEFNPNECYFVDGRWQSAR